MTTHDPQDDKPALGSEAQPGEAAGPARPTAQRHGKPALHVVQARDLVALNRREPPIRPSDTAGAAVPRADALDSEPILELPARRRQPGPQAERRAEEQAGGQGAGPGEAAGRGEGEEAAPPARIARMVAGLGRTPSPLRPAPVERSEGEPPAGPMVSLREAAQPYLARLAARRASGGEAHPVDDRGAARHDAAADQNPMANGQRAPQIAAPVCPLCHGVGFVRLDVPVGDKLFGHAVRCECKEREIEARERQKMRDLSSLKPFDKKGFETFDQAVPGVAEAHDVARRYADDPNGWLILQGGYGCGKTHLAAAIARAREEAGETVFFSIVPDLLDHLRATFAPASEITYDELFDRVRHVGLLVLDDLGSENATAWATEKLFQIINYRYNYRLPTVITTNVRLLSHLDERIRSRLSDLSLVRWVRLDAGDYRERHVGQGGSGAGPRAPRGGGARGGPRNGYGR